MGVAMILLPLTILSWVTELSGCLSAEPAPVSCVSCHGDPPGPALGGSLDPTYRGVGAHALHLAPDFSSPVVCSECHLVPEAVEDEGHIDTLWPAEVAWDPEGIAVLGGAAQPFDAEGLTCTVYCHGATLTGGLSTLPVWTAEGSIDCDSCHGFPPPPPHPASDACADCHGSITDNPAQHIDGTVTFSGGDTGTSPAGCTACHGQGDNPAPPPDTLGNTDTSVTAVGAHATHVAGAGLGKPVPCEACHIVPGLTDDAGHIDTPPAEVTFSGLALQGGASPVFNGTTCAGSYCHGTAAPNWTVVNGTQAACGTCHALPPPDPHPANDNCQGCHPPAGPGQTIDDPAQHIDGDIDQ